MWTGLEISSAFFCPSPSSPSGRAPAGSVAVYETKIDIVWETRIGVLVPGYVVGRRSESFGRRARWEAVKGWSAVRTARGGGGCGDKGTPAEWERDLDLVMRGGMAVVECVGLRGPRPRWE